VPECRSCSSVLRLIRPRTASTVTPKISAACATVTRCRLVCDRSSPTRGMLDHQDRGRKPLEANLARRPPRGRGLQASRRAASAVCGQGLWASCKIEAAVEASLGNLDHKCTCTSVHLAPEGQVCLGYRVEGGRLTRIRDRGVEVLVVRSEHRPPTPFSHPAAFLAIGGRMFLSPLRI
jgi:hypothetical protein